MASSDGNKTSIHTDGSEMILIPAGEFLMGDDDQSDNQRHTVNLSAYYIYKNLVTVGMYEKFCQDTGRKMPSAPSFNPAWSKKDHPIVNVSWEDADAYCKWAGVKLPTEQQWEKAARWDVKTGKAYQYPWGDKFDRDQLRCSTSGYGDSGGTASVNRDDRLGVSPYGINDMAGNVFQWCADWYDDKQDTRVLRGGSWDCYDPVLFRSAFRNWGVPTFRYDYGSFRCCASPGLR